MKISTPFKIGNCLVTPDEFIIQLEGEEKQSLQPKFIEVLCYLAQHHPRIVSREELIENIWGANSYVGEKSLTNAIWQLRKNITCDSNTTEVIGTIRKAGYKLIPKPQWQNITPDSLEQASAQVSANQINNLSDKEDLAKNPLLSYKNIILVLGLSLLALLIISKFLSNDTSRDGPIKNNQITKQPGSELFPAASPDGRYVVYSHVSTNKPTNLFMQDTWHPESSAQQLTFDNATEGHSVWSNDGEYLYFSRKNKVNKTCKYIRLKVLTHQEKELTNCPMRGGYYYLDISSDDKTLAVYDFSIDAQDSGIYFLDLNQEEITSTRFSCANDCGYKDRDMAFSPDGKSIAVTRRLTRFSENIYLINLTSKATTQLTFGEEDIVGLSWHPAGDKLIYGTINAGIRNGYVLELQSKNSKKIDLPGFSYPSFAKNTEQLFYQQRQEDYYIASFQLNNEIASSPFPVIRSDYHHYDPDYNQQNNLFTYISNESGFYELWSAKPDGSERKQLTYLEQNIRYPKWSHSGEKIAFLSSTGEGKKDNIYIFTLSSKKLLLLKSPFKAHNRPSWSWNDNAIITAIYGKKFTDLHAINVNNGKTKRLTFDGARYGIMNSATTLIYTKLVRGLWRKEIDLKGTDIKSSDIEITKKSTVINIISGKQFNSLYNWNYQSNGVYFSKRLEDHHQIIFHEFTKKTNNPILRLPLHSIPNSAAITYIPDLNKLLFTGLNFPQANIKMVENLPALQ